MSTNGHARGFKDTLAADVQWSSGQSDGITFSSFLLEEGNSESPMVVLSRFEPGTRIEPHTHKSNYFEYVIAGDQTVGKTVFRTGDVRQVTGGTGYGPIVVGDAGCTVIIVFQQAAGAMTVPLGRASAHAEA